MRFRACCVLVALLGPAASCAVADEPTTDSSASADEAFAIREFTETYSRGTRDVGQWALTTNDLRSRVIEPTGGNPGGYLYGEVASPIPTWSTASRRIDPDAGSNSIFVGNYDANHIRRISADLCVYQAGSWSASRTVTLQLVRWDVANATVLLEATYSLPDIPDVPDGWQHYKFPVDARSATIPPGWQLERGDGTPATDADWAALMRQIDVVGFGLWKPGYMYPALGLFELGIDNIHIGTW
jgi:hypothetical protein